jgi:hypothetical protein
VQQNPHNPHPHLRDELKYPSLERQYLPNKVVVCGDGSILKSWVSRPNPDYFYPPTEACDGIAR